jgi:ATP synthase protein I
VGFAGQRGTWKRPFLLRCRRALPIQKLARWGPKFYTSAPMSLRKHLRESKDLVALSAVGLGLVFSTFIGLAIGLWLDKVFHTKPLFTLVFLVLGITAGFVSIFRSVRRGNRDCSPKD